MNELAQRNATKVGVIGRFPPPLDGQSVATRRLADLLEPGFSVSRFSLSSPETDVVHVTRLRLDRVRHYLGLRGRLVQFCHSLPHATVVWTSISSSVLGHARDMLTVIPAFRPEQKVIAVVHRGDIHELFASGIAGPSTKRLIDRVDTIVFLSAGLAEKCAPWVPASKRLIIPNTISADVHCTEEEIAKRATRSADEPLRVLFLSNMIDSKGYPELIEALGIVQYQGLSIQARFAGRWPSAGARESFRGLLESAGIEQSATYVGALIAPQQIKKQYLWGDVFALPTHYPTEAHPLTIVEAMNAGLPVISTFHASIPEMVRDGVDGVLVPTRDVKALSKALMQVHDRETRLRMAASARNRFLEVFSPEIVRELWTNAIKS